MVPETVVKLNIGGTIFKTTEKTLTNIDGVFKPIFKKGVSKSGLTITKDENGNVFFDRSPKHFELILNYLRDEDIRLPTSKLERREIRKEAEYYSLEKLAGMCDGLTSCGGRRRAAPWETVKINVGGELFETTARTLQSRDGFFKEMYKEAAEMFIIKSEEGHMFMDRSPKHFQLILNYMRDGEVALPDSHKELEELTREAKHYHLEDLVKLCQRSPRIESEAIPKAYHITTSEQLDTVISAACLKNSAKPVLIIKYSVDVIDRLCIPDGFVISEFLNNYSNRIIIYFYSMQRSLTDPCWDYSLYNNNREFPATYSGTLEFNSNLMEEIQKLFKEDAANSC